MRTRSFGRHVLVAVKQVHTAVLRMAVDPVPLTLMCPMIGINTTEKRPG